MPEKQLSQNQRVIPGWGKLIIILILTAGIIIPLSRLFPEKQPEPGASLESVRAYFDRRVPALMDIYGIPGVNMALVQNGQVAWAEAYGYADLQQERKMTTDTYCRTQSISKSVTAWGVMKLVEKGDLDLDEPVVTYLQNWEIPDSPYEEEKVTVRQLLTHTSGMPQGIVGPEAGYAPAEKRPTLEENLTREAVLFQEPGTGFSYSNAGYNLLELLIEEVTGRDFADYMEEEILRPLGMEHATYRWDEELRPGIPIGSDLHRNPVPVYVYPEKGSGGLLAGAEDIARFIAAGMVDTNQHARGILSEESIRELYTPQTGRPGIYGLAFDSYGLGHFMETLADGTRAVSHGGQGYGVMTHTHSIPETGDGIVILTNSQRSWPVIAHLLSAWATWRGFSQVGMSKIILGQKLIWGMIGLVTAGSFWQLWELGAGILKSRRKFAPFSETGRWVRGIKTGLSLISGGILIWAASQDYLFLTSVFPRATAWGAYALALLSSLLLISAAFPRIGPIE